MPDPQIAAASIAGRSPGGWRAGKGAKAAKTARTDSNKNSNRVCVCYMTEHPLGHLHDTKRYGGGRQERKGGRRKGSGTTEDLPDVGVKESGRTEDVPEWARAEREVDESTTEDKLARRT